MTRNRSLAKGLGWFSIGPGAHPVDSPRGGWNVQIGLRIDRTGLMRALGAREAMAGMGV